MATEHVHDLRIDPYAVLPQMAVGTVTQRIVCADEDCPHTYTRPWPVMMSKQAWPKA